VDGMNNQTAVLLGQLTGVVLLIVSLIAGWKRAPFLKIVLPLCLILAVGAWFLSGTLGAIGPFAFLFWYSIGRLVHSGWDNLAES
jgi:hypothetical protein